MVGAITARASSLDSPRLKKGRTQRHSLPSEKSSLLHRFFKPSSKHPLNEQSLHQQHPLARPSPLDLLDSSTPSPSVTPDSSTSSLSFDPPSSDALDIDHVHESSPSSQRPSPSSDNPSPLPPQQGSLARLKHSFTLKVKGRRVGADPDSLPTPHTSEHLNKALSSTTETPSTRLVAVNSAPAPETLQRKHSKLKRWQSKSATKLKDWLHIQDHPHPPQLTHQDHPHAQPTSQPPRPTSVQQPVAAHANEVVLSAQKPEFLDENVLSPTLEVPTSSIEEMFAVAVDNLSVAHVPSPFASPPSSSTRPPLSPLSSPSTPPKSTRRTSDHLSYTYSSHFQSMQEYSRASYPHRRRRSDFEGGVSAAAARKRGGPGRIPPRSSSLPRSFGPRSSALLTPKHRPPIIIVEPLEKTKKQTQMHDDENSAEPRMDNKQKQEQEQDQDQQHRREPKVVILEGAAEDIIEDIVENKAKQEEHASGVVPKFMREAGESETFALSKELDHADFIRDLPAVPSSPAASTLVVIEESEQELDAEEHIEEEHMDPLEQPEYYNESTEVDDQQPTGPSEVPTTLMEQIEQVAPSLDRTEMEEETPTTIEAPIEDFKQAEAMTKFEKQIAQVVPSLLHIKMEEATSPIKLLIERIDHTEAMTVVEKPFDSETVVELSDKVEHTLDPSKPAKQVDQPADLKEEHHLEHTQQVKQEFIKRSVVLSPVEIPLLCRSRAGRGLQQDRRVRRNTHRPQAYLGPVSRHHVTAGTGSRHEDVESALPLSTGDNDVEANSEVDSSKSPETSTPTTDFSESDLNAVGDVVDAPLTKHEMAEASCDTACEASMGNDMYLGGTEGAENVSSPMLMSAPLPAVTVVAIASPTSFPPQEILLICPSSISTSKSVTIDSLVHSTEEESVLQMASLGGDIIETLHRMYPSAAARWRRQPRPCPLPAIGFWSAQAMKERLNV